jgi:predicted dienelactone hydrolase
MLHPRLLTAIGAALALLSFQAQAATVGERHLEAKTPTAALRDANHSDVVRVTVWYPAAEGVKEQSLDLGPPGKPFFLVGAAAPDAPFADARKRPVILFSHGFGGTARMMGWFCLPLARAGYVVVAVDHPGNNGQDKMTVPGSYMFWDRPGDLAAALAKVEADPAIGPHLDEARVGVAGFSAGGFTTLVSAGARVDINRFLEFCRANPADGVCKPQQEFAVTQDQARAALASPELAPETAHADDDHAIGQVRAAFAIAPAIVQALPPDGLKAMKVPVAIVLGDADPIATPKSNGLQAAALIPHAQLKLLPGVGHYDFLSTCTEAGKASIPICSAKVSQDRTHTAAIDFALAFFGKTLGKP